jgi:hypothetical protein
LSSRRPPTRTSGNRKTWPCSAFAVDAALVKLREEPMSDKERDKLLKAMAPVANKHYRPGAKYREEVALAVALGGLMRPRARRLSLRAAPGASESSELEGEPHADAEEKPKREINANLEAV